MKNPLLRKLKLRVWVYFQGEYLSVLGPSRPTLKCKTYSVVTQDNELEECEKKYIRKDIWQLGGKKESKREVF